MPSIQQKTKRLLKGLKPQSEETGQAKEPDSDVSDRLQSSDQKCKVTMINNTKGSDANSG